MLPTSVLYLPQQLAQHENLENLSELRSGNKNVSNANKAPLSSFKSGVVTDLLPQKRAGYANSVSNTNNLPSHSSFQDDSSSSEQYQDDFASQEDSVWNSGGGGSKLFSKIQNILPIGNGFLSGLLNSTKNSGSGHNGGYGSAGNPTFGELSDGTSLLSFHPSHASPSNEDSNVDRPNGSESSSGGGGGISSLLRFFPNPLKSLQHIFHSLIPSVPPDEDPGPLQNSKADGDGNMLVIDPAEGSAITPLLDDGLSGLYGAAVGTFTKLYHTIGVTAPVVKVAGLIFTPIFAAGISALVIGIVYLAIYIPAVAFQNEGIDGQLYLMTFNQLLELLGIPDPLDKLFGFERRRSLEALSYEVDNHGNNFLLAGGGKSQCLERVACEVIGKRFITKRSWWKTGWIGKGIKWVGESMGETHLEEVRGLDSFKWYFKRGLKLIQAVATGMTQAANIVRREERSDEKSQSGDDNNSHLLTCSSYSCDPIKSIAKLLGAQQRFSTSSGKPEVSNNNDEVIGNTTDINTTTSNL